MLKLWSKSSGLIEVMRAFFTRGVACRFKTHAASRLHQVPQVLYRLYETAYRFLRARLHYDQAFLLSLASSSRLIMTARHSLLVPACL
jgi:hypothetical protein